MSPDLICLGEPLMEFSQIGTGDDATYMPGYGGDTSNTAVAAARQGAHVGYLTALGTDAFGDRFMSLWQAEGIDTSEVLRNPRAHTGIYFITMEAAGGAQTFQAGHSFVYFRAGSAASLMEPDDLATGYIAGAKMLQVSGISQAISATACDTVFRAIQIARDNQTKVAFDTNLRLKLWPLSRARAAIHEAIRQSDIALPSLEDAEHLTGLTDRDAIADFYLGLGPSLVALKLGKEGVLIATPERREVVAGRPVEAVDTTGAGDTFGGSFLARLIDGDDPFAAAAYANAAAALSTLGHGAVAPIPRRDRVAAFLAETGTAG